MRAAWVAAACLSACSPEGPVIDSYPIALDLSSGVPVVQAHTPELDDVERTVSLDTASPVTVFDIGVPGEIDRRVTTVELFAPVLRARFPLVKAVLAPVRAVGVGSPLPVQGVVGGDVLQQVALRLDPRRAQLTFLPDVAGDETQHANACEAVLGFSIAGGGNWVAGSQVVRFAASRVIVGVCLAPAAAIPDGPTGGFPNTGRDALLVLATGMGKTVLTQSAWCGAIRPSDCDAAFAALTPTTVFLPSGDQVPGRLAQIPRLALVPQDTPAHRGPCAELLTGRYMELVGPCATEVACPCIKDISCASVATVEIARALDVVVVADTVPLVQGLRDELRPAVADIDGLLGLDALAELLSDVDYPNSRLILRCDDRPSTTCRVRPAIADVDRRGELRATLKCLP